MSVKINKFNPANTYKYLFVKLFFKNYFFIFFSFVNCLLPLAITFIVAYSTADRHGVDVVNFVMATGLISAFMIPFYQLGFTFSLAILNLLANMRKNDSSFMGVRQQYVIGQEYIGSVLIGILFSLMFCGLAVLYMHVAGNYPTTHAVNSYGKDFIFVTSPTVLISLLNSVSLFNIFYRLGNLRSTLIVFSELFIDLLFVCLLGLLIPKLNIYGFAIGLLLGNFVNFCILSIISWILGIKPSFKMNKDTRKHIWKIFKKMFFVSLSNVYFVFMRVIMVLSMAFAYKTFMDEAPYSFMMVKVIYFLILYALTFVGNGSSYTINYLKSKHQRSPNIFNASYKTNWIVPFFAFMVTAVCSIAFYFSVPALIKHFSIHALPQDLDPHNPNYYIGWDGLYGVQRMMGLPYNPTLLLICIDMPINAAAAAMIIEPIGGKKKNRFLVLWPQVIRPTVTITFIVGFGFGLFGRGPFQNMGSFAAAYTINAVVLFFIQLIQFSLWNKKFRENYKKVNFVNILVEYLLLKNKQNFRKVVEYNFNAIEPFHWPEILSEKFQLKDNPYKKIIDNEKQKMMERLKKENQSA